MLMNIRRYIKTEKGFTLIELVVVIAILGILAAIAIPRFTAANDSARGAKMQADLRTIDSAIQITIANGTAVAAGAIPASVAANLAATPTPPVNTFTTPLHPAGASIAAGVTYQISATQRATVVVTGTGAGTVVAETL